MTLLKFRNIFGLGDQWHRQAARAIIGLFALLSCLWLMGVPPAHASINDDRFDGNIYALYGGNGSLVPPRITLEQALKNERPTLVVFYVDDSSDCKQFAPVVSHLQYFYGRVADFLPLDVDFIFPKASYDVTDPGYYYAGVVPQTVLLDGAGKVVYSAKGQVPFEQVDDAFREVFDLLPRSESVELRRRVVNEFNTELTR